MGVNTCRKPLIRSGIDPDMKINAQSFLSFVFSKNSPNAQNRKKNGNQLIKSNIAKLLSQVKLSILDCWVNIWVKVLIIIKKAVIKSGKFQLSWIKLSLLLKEAMHAEISKNIDEKTKAVGNKNIPILKRIKAILFL